MVAAGFQFFFLGYCVSAVLCCVRLCGSAAAGTLQMRCMTKDFSCFRVIFDRICGKKCLLNNELSA